MTFEQRAEALLALVEADRETKRAAITGAAQDQARTLVADAYRRAHERVRGAHREERERRDAALASAHAEVQTRLRGVTQERERALVDLALDRLRGVLAQRWTDSAARERWVLDTLREALRTLPHGSWRVELAPGLGESEQNAIVQRLEAGGVTPALAENDALHAGLRVLAGAATLDMSIDALLSERDEIGARVLALMEPLP